MRFPRSMPARPAVRRALAFALATIGLALPAGLSAMPTMAANPIALISISSWQESPTGTTQLHIVGQVKNTTSGNVSVDRINVELQDSNSQAIETLYTDATVRILGPGELSPFELTLFPPPPNYDHFVPGTIDFSPTISSPYHSQLAAVTDPCPAGFSSDYVCGTVTNTGSAVAENVRAILTYLDSANTAVAQEHPFIDSLSLAPGASSPFQTSLSPDEPTGTGSPLVVAEPDYTVDLNPASLDFGGQNVTTTSTEQAVTLTNNGTAPFSVSGIQPSEDFSVSSNSCTVPIVAGGSCAVGVKFSPSTAGAVVGSLQIRDDAAGSPQTIPLLGKGTMAQIAFVPSALDFGDTTAQGTSVTKFVDVLNTGDGPLQVSNVTSDDPTHFSADASKCTVADVAPSSQCRISITFSPGMGGPFSATLTVRDNAGSTGHATQTVALSGRATGPGAVLTPPGGFKDFGAELVGNSGNAVQFTLSNPGNARLRIDQVSVSGDFHRVAGSPGDCGSTLAAASSCKIFISFSPTAAGPRDGQLTVRDNTSDQPQTVSLHGFGVSRSAIRPWTRVTPRPCSGPRRPAGC